MKTKVILMLALLASCSKDYIEEEIVFNSTPIKQETVKTVTNVNNITDLQSNCNSQTEVTNWNNTSYELFDIHYPENYDTVGNLLFNRDGMGGSGEYGFNVISVDYNNDGYKDVIGFSNDRSNLINFPEGYYGYERKQPIRFFKGSCEGNFEVDYENDSKYLGLVHGRKLLLGDFNNDSFVDVFFMGHGYDLEPRSGEFNKILMSNGEGGFNETEFTDYVSFIMEELLVILIMMVILIL